MHKRIDNYEIVGELGRGGMGVVYKAREESLQRYVAIKMLGDALVANESVAARFMREARAVADLSHPNLVQVFRVDRHEEQPYFVMEYVEGESLKNLIERERQMQPARALRILKEVATGLAAAHDKGVVHRDIKPENIMLTRYGGVKVVDFGIARVDEPGTRLTTTGIGLGTPSYLSPEVCLSQDVDQRSDIFSLGIVLFEMLTGDTPFKSDSPFELMTKVVEARVPDIKALNPNVDDGVRQILARMIAKRPKLRYQHCNELISDIEDHRAGRAPRWAQGVEPDFVASEPAHGAETRVKPAGGETPAVVGTDGQPVLPSQALPENRAVADVSGAETPTETVVDRQAPKPHRASRTLAVLLVLLVGTAGAGTWYFVAGSDSRWPGLFGDAEPADPVANGTAPARDPGVEVADAGDNVPPVASGQPTRTGNEVARGSDKRGGSADLDESAVAAVSDPVAAGSDRSRRSAGRSADGADPDGTASAPVGAATGAAVGTTTEASEGGNVADPAGYAEASPPADDPADWSIRRPDAPVTEEGAGAGRAADLSDPRIVIVAVGDPAVAGVVHRELSAAVGRAAFELLDDQLMDGLAFAETLAGVARSARDNGADVLVYANIVDVGRRELRFYGREELQRLAELEVRVVHLHRRRNLGEPLHARIEYVAMTAAREARQAAAPLARRVVRRLRAMRAAGS